MLVACYRQLKLKRDPDVINLHCLKLTTDPKKGTAVFELYNNYKWLILAKRKDEFLTPKTLKDKLGGISATKRFLGIDKTPLL